jgi:hypothetical protein
MGAFYWNEQSLCIKNLIILLSCSPTREFGEMSIGFWGVL